MALTNIEYGSIASSEMMNNNFSYLDDRISEVSASLNTVISSILSNIATINSRLADISETIHDDSISFDAKLEEYRNKSRLCINKITMLPNWSKCFSLTEAEQSNYNVPKNGYLLIHPIIESNGELSVNNTVIITQTGLNVSDNATGMYFIPVKAGDAITCSISLNSAYFLPAVEISNAEL